MFYDIKGWAWWHQINNIAANQPSDIKIDSIKPGSDFDHQMYDYIVVFEAYFKNIISKVPRDKLIIGCNCPKIMDEFLESLLLFKPLAGLVNSLEMYNRSKDYYKVFNCPNGVDEELFNPVFNKKINYTACWVGNSGHYVDKGLKQIRQTCEKSEIPLLTYDLSENKILLPHVDLRNKIYYKADFYICFSEYEGTPNPALEALSCGLPVITTRVGNMPEIIIDGFNGYFTDRDEASLFEAIYRLKSSDLHEMSLNARNSILNVWTWKSQSKNYTDMFRSLKTGI